MAEGAKFRGSVFISYRRADVPGYVRALMSELRNAFGSQQVFLDMEDIEAGTSFPVVIHEAVSHCELLLVIIGPTWLDARDASGRRRLDCEDDFVRLEIASGLRQQIPVIPVLIDNALMPAEESLPEALRGLTELQGITLSHPHWDDDIKDLLQAIERVTVEPQLARRYAEAMSLLRQGRWQEALTQFDAIQAVRQDYLDVAERSRTLRFLAAKLAPLSTGSGAWRRFLANHALAAMLAFCLLPNALAALFNYRFNWEVIVHPMIQRGVVHALDYFQMSVLLVNAIAFPLGLGLFSYLAYPIVRALRETRSAADCSLETVAVLRSRVLALGHYAALISVGLWCLAGPVYPLLIGVLNSRDYVYFIVSLSFCGILSASYPFLTISWLATRVLYLPLLRAGTQLLHDLPALDRLANLQWRYLWLAGALPLLVVSAGLAFGPELGTPAAGRLLAVLGLAGFAGFFLALRLFQALQRDQEVLRQVVAVAAGRPAENPSACSDPQLPAGFGWQ